MNRKINGKILLSALSLGMVIMVMLAGCASTESEGNSFPINWVGYEEGMQLAKQQGKPVMINFYSTWCSACKTMDRTVFEDPQIVETSKQFVNIKVNVGNHQEIGSKYGIYATPTTIILDSRGNEIRSVLGSSSAGHFHQYMVEVLEIEDALRKV